MVTHPASSLAHDRESSPAETSVLTTMLRRQLRGSAAAAGRNIFEIVINMFYAPFVRMFNVFRLDALALSVIATATWLGGLLFVTAGIVSKRLNLS